MAAASAKATIPVQDLNAENDEQRRALHRQTKVSLQSRCPRRARDDAYFGNVDENGEANAYFIRSSKFDENRIGPALWRGSYDNQQRI